MLGYLHYIKRKICSSSAADLERCSVLTKASAALCSLPYGRRDPKGRAGSASHSLPFQFWLCPHQQAILVAKRDCVNMDFGEVMLVKSLTGQKIIKLKKCNVLSQAQIRSRRAQGSISTGVL